MARISQSVVITHHNVLWISEQLKNIRQQTLSSIFCKTLEDDPDNPSLALNFQKQVLLLTREQADALSR